MKYRRLFTIEFDRKNDKLRIKHICRKITNAYNIGIKYFGGWNAPQARRVYVPCKIYNYVYNDLTLLVKKESPFKLQDYMENKMHWLHQGGLLELYGHRGDF